MLTILRVEVMVAQSKLILGKTFSGTKDLNEGAMISGRFIRPAVVFMSFLKLD